MNQSSGMTGVEGKWIIITSTEWPKNHRTSAYCTTPCLGTQCTKHGVCKVGSGTVNYTSTCTKIYLTPEVQKFSKYLGAILKILAPEW